jgi:hypothetical protein
MSQKSRELAAKASMLLTWALVNPISSPPIL